MNNQSSQDINFVTVKSDLEGIEKQDLEFEKHLIVTVPPKKIQLFTDPYLYVESHDSLDDGNTDPLAQASVEKT